MVKKIFLIMPIFFFFLFSFGTVVAEPAFSKADVRYDYDALEIMDNLILAREVLNESTFPYLEIFDNNVWINVIVRLKDKSNISITGSKEEKINLLSQREEWFEPKVDNVLSSLSKNEFKLQHKLVNGFSGWTTLEGYNKLISNTLIEKVDWPKVKIKAMLNESVPLIGVDPYVWNLGYTGNGVKVCIIDSGVNASHLGLSGKIVNEKCYCSDGLFWGCCPDGTDEDDSAEDDNGHGTHVAGIIASQDSTYKGVAYGADIYAVKILDENGDSSWGDLANALDWCRNQGVDIISMSLGTEETYTDATCVDYVNEELNEAYNSGIALVVASGNSGSTFEISYPACSPYSISVSATTKQDEIASYSNLYPNLDLLAPGSLIKSLRWNPNSCSEGCVCSGNYMKCSGTSEAAPHVSGAIALLLEADPTLEPDDILSTLQSTGKNVVNWKRINVSAAINTLCECTSWTPAGCGSGGCEADERYYTRTCPGDCNSESKCEYDASCAGGSPTGINACDYEDENSEDCPSGYTATDHDCYWSGSNWECELECWRDEYCNDWGSWTYTSNYYSVDENDENIWFDSPLIYFDSDSCYKFYGESKLYVSDWDPGGILHFDAESVRVYSDTEGYDSNTCSGGQSSPVDTTTSIYNFGQGTNNYYKERGKFIPYQQGSCSGDEAYGIEGYFYNYLHYQTADWYGEDTDYLYCDVPYTSSINIDSTIYGDSDVDCDITVVGSESNPDEIRVKWYVNGDHAGSETCGDNECDDDSGSTWSNTFTLDSSEYSKGDEVYCIGMGYGEDGGHGAYVQSSTTNVSNRIPTWSSVLLNESFAKAGDNIKLVANGEADLDSDWLSLYCCKGSSCTPTVFNHDFCYATGDNYPYDLFCVGQATREEGTQTVRCRIYDGDDYSSIQSDTYEAYIDDPPNATLISPMNNSVDEDGIINFNCSAVDDFNLNSVTLYGNWSGGWHANETKSLSGISNSTIFTKSLTNGIYEWNCLVYDNNSQSSWGNSSNWILKVNITSLPNDTYKFYIRNSTGGNVAWLGSAGNIVLKGSCFAKPSCAVNESNLFVIKNSTDSITASINSTGDLCIQQGDCSDESASCNPAINALIIRDSSSINMSYINFNGDLCLRGKLYENTNP